jgi:hypothetical protein
MRSPASPLPPSDVQATTGQPSKAQRLEGVRAALSEFRTRTIRTGMAPKSWYEFERRVHQADERFNARGRGR